MNIAIRTLSTLPAVDAYNAVFELATAADTKHASQHLAAYPPAITRIDSGRDELILTLPAEDLQHAADRALALMKATDHRPTRFEVLLAEEYDCRDRLRT
jgi:hypothetical protein